MHKHVILISGPPCVGKTSVAKELASKLSALYVNLTELVLRENLILEKDKERDTVIPEETRVKHRIAEILESCTEKRVVVDGHYAVFVVPKKYVTKVFVLRRNPIELKKLMEERGFSDKKLWENLASEILDVCLVDALKMHGKKKTCELNITGKSVNDVAKEILDILKERRKCYVGIVDWLGKLENEGILDEYLRF